jgi:dipeptidyl aminopeptidase/acylaminoacyl peptidase
MNADGSGLRQIATGLDPALSPDGSKVAFARWTGQKGIWILNLKDGSERLGFGHEHARSPSWTPDGSTIVFERTLRSWECRQTPLGCFTDQEIYDFFGGNDCRDFGWWGTYCIWDFPPKGIYFNYGLTDINLYTEKTRDLPTPPFAYAPYHSPVNSDVMMLIPEGIAVVSDLAGSGDHSLRRIISNGFLGAPVYSPDGKYIYVSQQSGDHWDIWRYNADGSNPVALTRPPGIRDRAIHSVAPAASPDGRSILFLTNREGDGSRWELWIMNSDGSNQRPFAPNALKNINFQLNFGRERVLSWR